MTWPLISWALVLLAALALLAAALAAAIGWSDCADCHLPSGDWHHFACRAHGWERPHHEYRPPFWPMAYAMGLVFAALVFHSLVGWTSW
ncbi:MAG: hypothetical protein ABSD62_14670 [Candidatus Limnocylindrales bacterium]|jgi:hypothetical protein